ncbi:XRE family transcriptional regulator [Burkholderia vietnamiensis]|uniref:XRE family transcriptional regulator n=1 Tax=Burkholderia vietnamiensis TaxID=60552 RepID=UPI001B8E1265|nr:XRE family transcriptional regulator [Burkholderia vietnamiensis]MBR8161326.1 XRE family transcriptional regulator [Burkholderia vietnamiensis]MCA8147886.1 XRE family transcriptional regulator [Burkholderia vietnamiensis]
MPIKYTPPTPEALAALKNSLGKTGKQMAELAWLAGDQHWRKYTNPNPEHARQMGAHMLFAMAAQLELDPPTIERILARMRAMGATIELDKS